MARLGWQEILLILLILLLLFGATRIPQLMRSLAQGLREFRKASRETDEEPTSGSSASLPKAPDDDT